MKSIRSVSLLIPFYLAVLSSCSHPPRDTWNRVRSEGLYYVLVNSNQEAPTVPTRSMVASTPQRVIPTQPAPKITPKVEPKPVVKKVAAPKRSEPPKYVAKSKEVALKTGFVMNGKPGYVLSPHTSPPKVLDVRGVADGSRVRCEYTKKDFLVPKGAARGISPSSTGSVVKKSVSSARKPTPKAAELKPVKATTAAQLGSVGTVGGETPVDAPFGKWFGKGDGIYLISPYVDQVSGNSKVDGLVLAEGRKPGLVIPCPYTLGKRFRIPPFTGENTISPTL